MTRYSMTVSISVFGNYGYDINSMISEYKSFIMNNSLLDIYIKLGVFSQLDDVEFGTPDPTYGYFVYPGNLLQSTKDKIPNDVQVNILMYDWKNKQTGYGGGTLGGNYGIYNGIPYIGIPLGQSPPSETGNFGSWNTLISQRLVHEWMHAFKWILDYKYNLTNFPNADGVCETYGYTISDGWYSCYQFFLSSFITTEMYSAIRSNECDTPICSLTIE